MTENDFVKEAKNAADRVLRKPLVVKRAEALLYQVTVDNRLELTVDPKNPKRGRFAFETDLCVFEEMGEINLPRVVMEFKWKISTHDVLTYSTKARRHKQVYPYLRYGIIVGDIETVPGRFFRHNEALDFCIAAASHRGDRLQSLLEFLLAKEVEASRLLERIAFNEETIQVYRQDIDARNF